MQVGGKVGDGSGVVVEGGGDGVTAGVVQVVQGS